MVAWLWGQSKVIAGVTVPNKTRNWISLGFVDSRYLPTLMRQLEPWMAVQNLLKDKRPILLSEEDQQALLVALKISRNWKGHQGEPSAEDWEALVTRANNVLAEAAILQLLLQGRMRLTLDNEGNVSVADG